MEADQVKRDWQFNINLAGVAAPTGTAELPEGYYVGKITDMYVDPGKNPNRVIIKVQVAEGPFSGVVRTDGMNIPTSPDDKIRHYWRGLAESAGYQPTQLDAGVIGLGASAFVGKTITFKYQPKNETNQYDRMLYLARAEWDRQRANFTPSAHTGAPAASVASTATAALPPAATLGGPGPMNLGAAPAAAPANGIGSKNDVLSALGISSLG